MSDHTVAVVGLGYVGLPLALLAAEKGWQVVGYESNAEKVALLNQRQSPINDPALREGLKKYVVAASTDPVVVATAQVIVVCVPTPVTGTHRPDLAPLKQAVRDVLPHLRAGQILSIESTINPGVMDEVVLPLLRKRKDLAMDADATGGAVLYVVHCPERINPGDTKWTIRSIPRVVGGYSAAGVAKAKAFYESIIDAPVMAMDSVAEAEAVKILENSFRDINIAFVNEMAKSFDKLGIDITTVIKGASTKPFSFLPHWPGNGVGGHCISVDPYYMIERGRQAGFDHHFLKLARKINDSMPAYVMQQLAAGLKKLKLPLKKARVAVLGVAYKKNVDDVRNSPVLVLLALLKKKGITPVVFDPFIPQLSTVASLKEALSGADVVILGTDHDEIIKALPAFVLSATGVKLVVDGKNALPAGDMAAHGILYYGIGRFRYPKTPPR